MRRLVEGDTPVILDRSLPGDRVFALANRRFGYMTEREFGTYDKFYQIVVATTRPLDLVIYLRTTPEIIWDRVKSRAREEEAGIDQDYFRTVCEEYDTAIAEGVHNMTTVVTVDWSEFKPVDQLLQEVEAAGVILR